MNPSTQPASREAFVATLGDSGLLSVPELRAATERVAACADGLAAARELIAAGKLTPFQADALLHDRAHEVRLGNYEVLSQLGKGGMGTVYKARHRRMKRVVALKVLSPEMAGEASFVQRFQREVETIANLTHPNIVMAFDADEAEGRHFLVMEFVEGRDLASEVLQNGPLSVAGAVGCLLQAAAGLEYAHARGIIHRDIKPANLLRDVGGVVKVADLGLARLSGASGGSLTQAGGIVGTTEFMPPEQAMDSTTIDHRADIYALACTLYFLLTGRPPFAGKSFMAVLLKHRDAPIPSLRDQREDMPPRLESVFTRAMAKKPEDRYPSMTEFIRALEEVRDTAPLPTDRPAAAANALPIANTVATDSAGHLMATRCVPDLASSSAGAGGAPSPSDVVRISDLAVVLVEPSRTQAGIIRKYFQQLGVEKVHVTGSGRQALELVRSAGAQVLFSSLHLSDMTGVQLAQALRAEADLSEVGFVLTTSEDDTAEAEALVSALARTVLLPKPFDLRKLTDAMAVATGGVANGAGVS